MNITKIYCFFSKKERDKAELLNKKMDEFRQEILSFPARTPFRNEPMDFVYIWIPVFIIVILLLSTLK